MDSPSQSPMFVIQPLDASSGPLLFKTTEGQVAVMSFTSRDAAQEYLESECSNSGLVIVALPPAEYVAWLRNAAENHNATMLSANPSHVRDVGNYKVMPISLPLTVFGSLG